MTTVSDIRIGNNLLIGSGMSYSELSIVYNFNELACT